MDSRLRGNDKQ